MVLLLDEDTSSINETFDELDGNYFVLLNANETWAMNSGIQDHHGTILTGSHFTSMEAPLPDLVAEPATCPMTAETTGYTAPFMAQVSSIGGPMDSTAFGWELTLVDEEGNAVMVIVAGKLFRCIRRQ